MRHPPELMFPILNDPIIKAIPWAAILGHEAQAMKNHSQTLKGLASRGGLDVIEAYSIISDKPFPWRDFTPTLRAAYRSALMRLLLEFERSREAPAEEAKP